MSTQIREERATEVPNAQAIDMKLEVVVIPVSDVERSNASTEVSGGGSTQTFRDPGSFARSR